MHHVTLSPKRSRLVVAARCAVLALVLCVLVVPASRTARAEGFEVRGFTVSGESPLSDDLTREVLAPYVGTHEGVTRLLEASRALETELRARGYTFHRVVVPPQELADGIVRLEVVSFRLGEVTVDGNSYTSAEGVRASLPPLVEGEPVNGRELTRALQLANTLPSRRVSVAVSESETPDHIDAEVRVREVRPWALFLAMNNTGSEETGRARVLAGFQHSNLLDRDDTLTATYTTSPGHADEVRQYGIAYRLPLYQQASWLTLFATRSEADSGQVAGVFDVSGKGTFYGAHLRHLLLPVGPLRQYLEVGLEDHLFEDDTLLVGGPPVGRDVRSRPLSFAYGGDWDAVWGKAGYSIAYVRNITSGSNQDSLSYSLNGNGAKPQWDLLHASAYTERALPSDMTLHLRGRAQYAGQALISGERFGVAGSNAVRGFDERSVTGDDGFTGSAEVWTAPLFEGVRALAFVDVGYQHSNAPVSGSPASDWLSSAGVGVRMEPARGTALWLDVARVINGAGTTDSGDYGAHLSLVFRF